MSKTKVFVLVSPLIFVLLSCLWIFFGSFHHFFWFLCSLEYLSRFFVFLTFCPFISLLCWLQQDIFTLTWTKVTSTLSGSLLSPGWHKLFKPSSRALRIFPIYEDFWGFLWSQRVKMRPPIGGVKAVLSPQSSLLNPQSSVLSPQKCSQKLDLPACQYFFKCSKCSNVYGTSGIQVIPCRI